MKPQDTSPTRIAAAPPVINPTLRESKPAEIAIAFPDNAAASVVFGHYDQNIARIERSLGVSAYANGNQVVIKGPREASEQARRVFEMLYERVKQGQPASEGDVEGVIAESAYQGLLFPGEEGSKDSFGVIKTRKRGVVRARSAAQDQYMAALRKYELVFAEGPAGTGKTWLAVGHAVSLLEQGLVERLVLSRPAVEAGERLGFLPGDMRDKVDPYLRPIYDALYDFMDGRMVERGIQTGMIEIAPLAFMRGRTLSKAAILSGRSAERDRHADEDVPDPPWRGFAHDGQRRSEPDRPRARTEIGAWRCDRPSQVDPAHRSRPLHPCRRGPPRSCAPDRRGLWTRGRRGTAKRGQMKVSLDISVPSSLWRGLPRARAIARETIAAAAAESGAGPESDGEPLPRRRRRPCARSIRAGAGSTSRPTCCLFPRRPVGALGDATTLGDIALAYETLAREAEDLGVPLADHYRHLVAHGFLHLIGYDHETDAEAERMEALETRILARLGAADPYAREVVGG